MRMSYGIERMVIRRPLGKAAKIGERQEEAINMRLFINVRLLNNVDSQRDNDIVSHALHFKYRLSFVGW